jgi:uncharacterized protein (DUF2147 family)
MKRVVLGLAIVGMAFASVGGVRAADTTSPRTADLYGVWRNPKGSVHLEIKACGEDTCGFVVWASPEAQADVRKGGNRELVGMQLLRDFSPTGSADWKGRVFVPDLNMTFSGQVRLLDRASLRAKGCLLPNFLCKSQVWTRVDPAARAS